MNNLKSLSFGPECVWSGMGLSPCQSNGERARVSRSVKLAVCRALDEHAKNLASLLVPGGDDMQLNATARALGSVTKKRIDAVSLII